MVALDQGGGKRRAGMARLNGLASVLAGVPMSDDDAFVPQCY